MPTFFFDMHDGHQLVKDDEGAEFAGPEEARLAALKALAEIACDELAEGRRWIEVRDQAGRVVAQAEMTLSSQRLEH